MPIRSASANFSPARWSRSSSKTARPGAPERLRRPRRPRSSTPGSTTTCTSYGATDARPHDAVLVVVLLHDRGDRPGRPDPVAAHHDRLLAPVLVEERRAERLGVERAELEDVADLDRRLDAQPAAALGAGVALARLADVRERRLVVAACLARRAGATRPGSRRRRTAPRAALSSAITSTLTPTGPSEPPPAPNVGANLVVGRGPERRLEDRHQLLLAQPVVATHEREHEPVACHDRHRLRRRRRVDAEELRQRLDRRHAGRLDLLRRGRAPPGTRARAARRAPPRCRRSSRRSRSA